MKKRQRTIATATLGALLLPLMGLTSLSSSQAATVSPLTSNVNTGVQSSNTVPLRGAIGAKYNKNRPALGAPKAAEICAGTQCWQNFRSGEIYWSKQTGSAMLLGGEIRTRYQKLGAQKGILGLPTMDKRKGLKEGGQWQRFLGGGIFYHPSYGAHAVSGGMWGIWSQYSRENGALGFPIGDEYNVTGGAAQKFQGGTMYWTNSKSTGFVMLHGEIKQRHENLGSANSPLGLPVGNRTSIAGGYFQQFEKATMVWGPNTGAKYLDNSTFHVWRNQPAVYGWPTKDSWTTAQGINNQFQKSQVIWKNGVLSSSQQATNKTAVILCDSQCEGYGWGEQGAAALGYTDIVERGYGGGGYAAPAALTLGSSLTDALYQNRINLPQGNPGLVMLTLGGNDASQGYSDAQILTQMRLMIARVKTIYPNSQLVINGVMSRNDSDHARRRAVDALVTAEAKRQGISYVSVAGWGTTLKPGYRDAVHLNQNGHNTVAPSYAAALKKTLGTR